MIRTLRNLRRLAGIGRTLARHDALFPLQRAGLAPGTVRFLGWMLRFGAGPAADQRDRRPGERLTAALQALGPSFIKLGQALSVRSDLVGEAMAEDLSALQDRLTPFPGAEARAAIEAEFGRPVEELFDHFENTPVAAASIAQVHFATTTDGDAVAVKVLRPGIEAAFAGDLDLLRWLAECAERRLPEIRRLRPTEVMDTLARSVAIEMDLRLEAAAGEELAANFDGDPSFRVPAMDWARTGRRVLTLARVDGVPIDEVEAIRAAGHDIETIVANMARAFFLQVFRDGFFHADLHPGNLLIGADGAIQAVDFGIMGRLDRRTRYFLAQMLASFLAGDYRRVAEVHIQAGYVPADQSVEDFAQAARSIAEPILGLPLGEISLARLLAQLFQVAERFRMETQPQLLLLQKTMLVAEGVSRRLQPDTNMWELARPLIERWMEDSMTAEARAGEAIDEAGKLIERLPALVSEMGDSVGRLARDGLRLHDDVLDVLGANRKRPVWPWVASAALVAGVVIAVW